MFAFNRHALCFLEQVVNQLYGWMNAFCQGTVMQKYPTFLACWNAEKDDFDQWTGCEAPVC